MKTKNIFKALAMAMLMPAMLLTTACSSDDSIINDEPTAKKGYALPVTVNVTREGDATRATYNDNGNGTGSLDFSSGDKLFVYGSASGAGKFAGALDYVPATGKFSGTIYTQNDYDGTADALFSAAFPARAILLPNGYDSYNFLSISNNNTPDVAYDDVVSAPVANAFVASETAKATGVEQLSWEQASTYNSGFALAPANAVLNFTISGLEAGEKTVTLKAQYSGMDFDVIISGSVTPNASGVATFAIGVSNNLVIKNVANNLTVGSSNFTLSSTALAAGKIYNITRGTGTTVDLSTKSTAYTAQNGQTLTGALASNVKISIADGATVILHNVNINGSGTWTNGNFAGITCEGDATIILSGTNTVKGFYEDYPGIYVPESKTVTIQGSGSLTASSNGWAAGIGGGNTGNCGNITITGGNITATGGSGRAGIGGGSGACGNITITGGTITATGGNNAAGIGGGTGGTCGNITITNGVTRVTATKGNIAPNSIGAGGSGTCGTVTIGGVVTGAITDSPYTYTPAPAPAPAPAWNANEYNEGSWNSTLEKVEFTKQTAATTPTALTDVTENVSWSDGWYTVSGDVTINGNVTLGANTYLILQDDAELTINGYVWGTGNHYSLFIYGQEKGNGKLIVNASKNGLVYGFTDFEIHGGEITFENTNTSTGFALSSTNFKMYGGKLTAIAAAGNAIQYNNTDIYGGEVVATATGDYHYGMKNNNSSSLLTVYGGKLTAGNTDYNNKAISGNVKSGVSTIQFYGSADGNTWSAGQSFDTAAEIDYTTGIFNDVKYVKAE